MNDLKTDIEKIFKENEELSKDIFYSIDVLTEIFCPFCIVCIPSYSKEGGEDQGSDYFVVSKFSRGDDTVYIKHQGYYSSGYGAEYESWGFVVPKEVIVIRWEEIKG
mgnify:CR=1 FL=1